MLLVAEITKLLFGESRRHIIPVGKTFTVEDVQAQQPDTEDFLDAKNLAPGMFATPPKDDPPKPAAGDSAPEASAPVSITVQTPEVLLKSKPKAAPEPASASAAVAGASSSAYWPQLPASPVEEHVQGYVKSYWMEDHLPEYQYTMVTITQRGMKYPASFSTVLPTSWNSLVHRMWKLLQNRFVSTNTLPILPRV